MWSEMLNWRREYGVDSIVKVKFEDYIVIVAADVLITV